MSSVSDHAFTAVFEKVAYLSQSYNRGPGGSYYQLSMADRPQTLREAGIEEIRNMGGKLEGLPTNLREITDPEEIEEAQRAVRGRRRAGSAFMGLGGGGIGAGLGALVGSKIKNLKRGGRYGAAVGGGLGAIGGLLGARAFPDRMSKRFMQQYESGSPFDVAYPSFSS